MDSPGTKRQAISEEIMATPELSYFKTELEHRRQHLVTATSTHVADDSLRHLLSSVDEALSRLQHGTFGICEECHETIEADRLLCDPLLRFCIDHLSQAEQRALEADLTLAAKIQRALLPRTDWGVDGWQARYHYQPAGLVSGDYCDLIEEDGGFLFLLGDVSGKGVAASMLMSHLARDDSFSGWTEIAASEIGGACQPACSATARWRVSSRRWWWGARCPTEKWNTSARDICHCSIFLPAEFLRAKPLVFPSACSARRISQRASCEWRPATACSSIRMA